MRTWHEWFLGILIAAAMAGPVSAEPYTGSTNEGQIWPAATASEQIQAKAVILRQRRRGALRDFEIRVDFDRVPAGKEYQFYFYDAGMKRDGFPPAPVPNASHRFSPDSKGHLEFGFVLDGFSKGEWIQCTLRSSDRSIQKTIRFIPFK